MGSEPNFFLRSYLELCVSQLLFRSVAGGGTPPSDGVSAHRIEFPRRLQC